MRDGGTITLPDFIGTDYTVYTASGYFPLSPTASWTYERTENGGAPAEYRVSAAGSVSLDGFMYRVISPAGLAGTMAYRVDGNHVYAILENRKAELLRFAVVPGETWKVMEASGVHPVEGTFLGLETVTTPAGTFTGCLKYEVKTVYGQTSHETSTLWFAKGAGLVRSERVLVNYGEVRERVVDTLKSRTE